jgi:hypothetical protein
MRTLKRVALILLAAMASVWLGLLVLMWPERGKIERGATQIRAIHSRLSAATSRADVARWLKEPEFRGLSLRTEGRSDWLIVATPGAGNAENWQLVLEFDGEALRASRIGTLDSLDDHPDGAPPHREYAREPRAVQH